MFDNLDHSLKHIKGEIKRARLEVGKLKDILAERDRKIRRLQDEIEDKRARQDAAKHIGHNLLCSIRNSIDHYCADIVEELDS